MRFSIITVNYNNCDGLNKTILSVINQNYKDYEFIVIDGGSTDGSVDIIKLHESYITYWISEKDDGIYQAMNKGIRQAKGEYLNFMNSGDTFFDADVLNNVEKELSNYDIVIGKEFHQNPKTGKQQQLFYLHEYQWLLLLLVIFHTKVGL